MARSRLDGWGQPLPELANARVAVQKDTPHNLTMRRFVHVLLEEQWSALLRRGVYADVTVSVRIRDGVMDEVVEVIPKRQWRVPDDGTG